MHKHHGDEGRRTKFMAYADVEGEWEQPRSRRGHATVRRMRHKPYERKPRTNRVDWLDDMESEFY